jgi:hypothetical protein
MPSLALIHYVLKLSLKILQRPVDGDLALEGGVELLRHRERHVRVVRRNGTGTGVLERLAP